MTQRVLFYVQHLLGIGHVYRARRICDALHAEGCELTLVTGGMPVPVLSGTPFAVVQLAPLRSSGADFAGLVDEAGTPAGDDLLSSRRSMLVSVARALCPDVAITEAYPFGRRQMRHELLPLLETLKAEASTKILCSIRDILQENRKAGRDQETVDLVNRFYDGVLVHGDPRIARLADTFPPAGKIAVPVHHTGIVAPPPPPCRPRGKEIIVSAGGGVVGEALLMAAAQAAALPQFSGYRFVLSTGPNLPAEAGNRLRAALPANAQAVPFIDDLPGRLAGCALSISQAGYNTVADILASGCRAVLIPFAARGETEQSVRAKALERLGRAVQIAEDGLTPASLAEAMACALAAPPSPYTFDLTGASRTAQIVCDLT